MLKKLSAVVYLHMFCIAYFVWDPLAQKLLPAGFNFSQSPFGRGHIGAIVIVVALAYGAFTSARRIVGWIGDAPEVEQPKQQKP